MTLRFAHGNIESLTWYPLEEEPGARFVLLLTAPLYVETAEQLGVRGLCFDDAPPAIKGKANGGKALKIPPVPRKFEGKIGLPVSMSGGSLDLLDASYKFQRCWKFKVGRREDAPTSDITLCVTMRIHFDGTNEEILRICNAIRKGDFAFNIEPAQGELDLAAGEDADDRQEARA